MRKPPQAALVIFARHPAGRAKTRLVPVLRTEAARNLHRALIDSTARLAASLPRSVDKWVFLTPLQRGTSQTSIPKFSLPRTLHLEWQRGRNLGARLAVGFDQLFAQGYQRVVVIGSDSPTLSRRRVREALTALRRADAVFGPADDGGYYLVGLRARQEDWSEVLRGVRWGTRHAFRDTLARFRAAGLRTKLLPVGYDVDTAADLRRLQQDLRRKSTAQLKHLQPLRAWFARQSKKRFTSESRDRRRSWASVR